ncbi:MAG: hypothetical protein HYR55_09755 [Acidobacteria bacterium]|nr:hypothetical protein [Acidobacteriota bacterium]MBI3657546.1 hypothetical protein [Acidobacteriota bacterium]
MTSSRRLILALVLLFLCALMTGPASAGSSRYRIIDLTERAPVRQAEARSVNQAGEVVGFELLPDFQAQAVYWNPNHDGYLLPRLTDDNSNSSYHINDSGLITGVSELVTIERVGDHIRVYFDSKASLWQGGVITDLNTLIRGGDDLVLESAAAGTVRSIITGIARRPYGNERVGFRFDNGIVTELTGFPEGSLRVQPWAISESGRIVGEFSYRGTHAFSWQDGVMIDLHNHPSLGGVTSRAFHVNNANQIVGEAQFLISHPESPVLWENGIPINLVGHLFSRPQGIATAINSAGQIIGFVKDLDDRTSPFEGFLIEDGQYRRLLDLIPQDEGWDALLVPWDINENGWIVGGGMRHGQLGHAWLLIPNPLSDEQN